MDISKTIYNDIILPIWNLASRAKINWVNGFKTYDTRYAIGGIGLLGKKLSFNANSTADQLITLSGGTKFILTDVILTNASINLDTAQDFRIYTATSRGGTLIVNGGNLDVLTTPLKFMSNVQASFISFNLSQVQVGNSLYSSLGTAQGITATVDIYVFGYTIA